MYKKLILIFYFFVVIIKCKKEEVIPKKKDTVRIKSDNNIIKTDNSGKQGDNNPKLSYNSSVDNKENRHNVKFIKDSENKKINKGDKIIKKKEKVLENNKQIPINGIIKAIDSGKHVSKKSENEEIISKKNEQITKSGFHDDFDKNKRHCKVSNDSLYVPGLNMYVKCGKCKHREWLNVGFGSYSLAPILYMRDCSSCNKESEAILLKLIISGPSKYNYFFVVRDNQKKSYVLKDRNKIIVGVLDLSELSLKYDSFAFAGVTTEKIN